MKLKTYDKIFGTLFAVANIVIIVFFFSSNSFFEWAFARHHNTLSWYIRPLFIIPIVLGAFKKSYTIIFASIFCLFTSMFWFLIVISALLKVIHSVIFSGNSGLSIVKPAILGVVICASAILILIKKR